MRNYALYLSDRRSAGWQMPANSYSYWLANITRFRALAPVALKALEFPLSSISAERTFGTARAIDVPRRKRQSRKTFCGEVFLRVNRPYTLRALSNAIDNYQAL